VDTQDLKKIIKCEVCGSKDLDEVLDLGLHPMCDDLVQEDHKRECREYPIEILFCTKCCTAHQKFQIPKKKLFPSTYHYRSRFTNDVLNGMKDLVQQISNKYGGLSNKLVLDIGCNDGSLLDFFKSKGAITLGIEPTDSVYDAQVNHTAYKEYLSSKISKLIVKDKGHPSVITFTNVFAHIDNLEEVLTCLDILMDHNTILVIENHYLGSVLSKNQFDTFYHEHPRTYSFYSFLEIARSLNMNLHDVEFPKRYGGNIRVFIGRKLSPLQKEKSQQLQKLEDNFHSELKGMSSKIRLWKKNKNKILLSLKDRFGPLNAKAFPGRAAILVKLLGLDETIIKKVYEKPNSHKIGHYVPGTRIPISSDDEFPEADKDKPIINFAWHLDEEIQNYLKLSGHKGDIISLLSESDFE